MLTFNVINNNIVGSIDGEDFSTPYKKDTWASLTEAQGAFTKAESLEDAKNILKDVKPLVLESAEVNLEDFSDFLVFNNKFRTYHLRNDGKVSPISLPKNLVDKMKYVIDNELPVDPLVKFTLRTLRNPNVFEAASSAAAAYFLHQATNYTFQTFTSPNLFKKFHEEEGLSEEVAREMAQVPQTPISMEGLMLTKKVVRPLYDKMRYRYELDEDGNPRKVLRDKSDKQIDPETGEITWKSPEFAEDFIMQPYVMRGGGDAFYCGVPGEEGTTKGHIIRIGQLMSLENWDQVNCDPQQTCRRGLHAGNYDYINGFEHSESLTLECLMDPRDIGAIPHHDISGVVRGFKMMPCAFKDRSIDNRNVYHPSTYAELSDSQWETERLAVIENYQGKVDEVQKQLDEITVKTSF